MHLVQRTLLFVGAAGGRPKWPGTSATTLLSAPGRGSSNRECAEFRVTGNEQSRVRKESWKWTPT
eukprot:7958861-Pyramimonas_sp.AAC.1